MTQSYFVLYIPGASASALAFYVRLHLNLYRDVSPGTPTSWIDFLPVAVLPNRGSQFMGACSVCLHGVYRVASSECH